MKIPLFQEPSSQPVDQVTDDEIKEALTDYAKTASRMPAQAGMGWLNDQHSRIHERINHLLDQLGA